MHWCSGFSLFLSERLSHLPCMQEQQLTFSYSLDKFFLNN